MATNESLTLDLGLETVHRWQRMPECDKFIDRRSYHTIVSYKDAIYVFGGNNGEKMLNNLLRFDVRKKSWEEPLQIGSPPAPRHQHSAVVNGTSMYVFGGYTGHIQIMCEGVLLKNDLFEYNFQTGQWTEWTFVGKCPLPRCGHGAAVHDNKLWIFAGYDGNARLNDMWTISLLPHGPKKWEEVRLEKELLPTYLFPLAVTLESMFIMTTTTLDDIYQFHFDTRRWTRLSTDHERSQESSVRRYGHTMVSFDRHLYIFGGTTQSNLTNDLHCYDLDIQTWNSIVPSPDSQIPLGRLFHAATVIGDAMFVFGGKMHNVCSAEMYRFQFASYPRCTWHDDFGRLLRIRPFCDMEFIVGPKETRIPAHAAVIVARSEFLRTYIQQAYENMVIHLKDIRGTVNILVRNLPPLKVTLKDTTPESFEVVLRYIYTDRIDLTKALINETEDLQSNRIFCLMMDVYRTAKEFNLKRLERMCFNYLEATVSHKNVLEALRNAVDWNLCLLREFCLNFVVRDDNYNVIMTDHKIQSLNHDLILEIMKRRQVL